MCLQLQYKDSLEILENTYFEVFAKKKPVCPNLHQQKQETSNSTTIN
jgi:hypothetical protein